MGEISTRAQAATVLTILSIVFLSFLAGVGLSTLASILIGYKAAVDLPVPVRVLGVILAGFGVFSIVSVLRFRRLRDVLDSTTVTVLKAYHRTPLMRPEGRKEGFIPKGPYRYVRNPMYTGAVCLAFGLSVAFSSIAGMFWGAVLAVWFEFVWIPFEERELEALFGKSYLEYKCMVPKLFPNGKSFKPQT
jgi:protein-S-isoprenylcysteine O-methyltransferase Ste14